MMKFGFKVRRAFVKFRTVEVCTLTPNYICSCHDGFGRARRATYLFGRYQIPGLSFTPSSKII
jgi:hypothetical protein